MTLSCTYLGCNSSKPINCKTSYPILKVCDQNSFLMLQQISKINELLRKSHLAKKQIIRIENLSLKSRRLIRLEEIIAELNSLLINTKTDHPHIYILANTPKINTAKLATEVAIVGLEASLVLGIGRIPYIYSSLLRLITARVVCSIAIHEFVNNVRQRISTKGGNKRSPGEIKLKHLDTDLRKNILDVFYESLSEGISLLATKGFKQGPFVQGVVATAQVLDQLDIPKLTNIKKDISYNKSLDISSRLISLGKEISELSKIEEITLNTINTSERKTDHQANNLMIYKHSEMNFKWQEKIKYFLSFVMSYRAFARPKASSMYPFRIKIEFKTRK